MDCRSFPPAPSPPGMAGMAHVIGLTMTNDGHRSRSVSRATPPAPQLRQRSRGPPEPRFGAWLNRAERPGVRVVSWLLGGDSPEGPECLF